MAVKTITTYNCDLCSVEIPKFSSANQVNFQFYALGEWAPDIDTTFTMLCCDC